MSKEQIKTASPIVLFRHVFGMQKDQKLSEFVTECSGLRDNKEFVEEVRSYALANAV